MKSVHHAPDASSKEAVIGIINATLTSPEALAHAAQSLKKAKKPDTLGDSNIRAVNRLTRVLAEADRDNPSPKKAKKAQYQLTRLLLVMAGNPEHSHTAEALAPLMNSDQIARIHEPSTIRTFLGELCQAVSAINPDAISPKACEDLRKVISNESVGTPVIFKRTPNGLRVIARTSGKVIQTIVSPSSLRTLRKPLTDRTRTTREELAIREQIEADPRLATTLLGQTEAPKPAPRIPGLIQAPQSTQPSNLVSLAQAFAI